MVEITLTEFRAHRNAEGQTSTQWVQSNRENPEYSKGTFLTAAIQICQISRGDVRESKN